MGTDVRLPASLLFPVEVVETLANEGDEVRKHAPLLKLKYWNRVPDGTSDTGEDAPLVTKEFYMTFESPFDGEIEAILVSKNERINDSEAVVVVIAEKCAHEVQYGGLCAICGRELADKDYMGYSETQRAPIAMAHDTSGLTVSRTEAERLELRSHAALLKQKRLILVVDLDQTVIHCSANPEIGRWMTDPANPNYDAVKDVHAFTLREKLVQPANSASGNGFSREQPCTYYVKVRDGVDAFLKRMNSLYEMHVYTMATKQYALEIAKIIDPTGEYFQGRILSRDASDSLVQKNLKRLFPVSTRMVTVIDDRGDVWNWSPHLIKVLPFCFWSGTGDINSRLLPHRSGLVTPTPTLSQPKEVGKEVGKSEESEPQPEMQDREMETVGNVLAKLHSQFYKSPKSADVAKLLPALKSVVFENCVLLFSGFFPVNARLDDQDIVQFVRSFGAVVVADFLPSVTHVVAKNSGTLKARQAAAAGKRVVGIEWVFACVQQWKHVPETSYLLHVQDPVQIDQPDPVRTEEDVNPSIANGFMRSLQRGEVDWAEMDEELEELLAGDDDEDPDEDEDEDKDDTNDNDNDKSNNDQPRPNALDALDALDVIGIPEPEKTGSKRPRPTETESNKRQRNELEDDLGLDEDWD